MLHNNRVLANIHCIYKHDRKNCGTCSQCLNIACPIHNFFLAETDYCTLGKRGISEVPISQNAKLNWQTQESFSVSFLLQRHTQIRSLKSTAVT